LKTSASPWGRRGGRTDGFTLIEALMSAVILGMMSAVISALFISGIQTMEADLETVPLDSALRSKMEYLISLSFDQLNDGSETVTIDGTDYTMVWTSTLMDMNGDTIPEPTIATVKVFIGTRSLTTIIVDNEGEIGRL
jgi:hypothetical protein